MYAKIHNYPKTINEYVGAEIARLEVELKSIRDSHRFSETIEGNHYQGCWFLWPEDSGDVPCCCPCNRIKAISNRIKALKELNVVQTQS